MPAPSFKVSAKIGILLAISKAVCSTYHSAGRALRFVLLRNVTLTVGLGVLLCGSACIAQASGDKEEEGLKARLLQVTAAHHGKVAFFATQLNTGKVLELDADMPVQTASVIKLAILFEAMEQVRSGKERWEEKLQLPPGYAVGGSGLLQFFDTPLNLTLKDVLTMMIVVSDNTATDLAIDRLGVEAVNARIAWMGLKDTYLYKRIGKPATGPMPTDQPRFGLGKTTPREIVGVLERIGRCQLAGRGEQALPGDAAICQVALKMLRSQFYRETIPRYLEKLDSTESGSGIASKTGSLDAVRADVAIVAGKTGPILISIFTYANADHGWTVDNEGEVTIAKLAKLIVEAWSPSGIDGKTLVPGLGLPAGVAEAGSASSYKMVQGAGAN